MPSGDQLSAVPERAPSDAPTNGKVGATPGSTQQRVLIVFFTYTQQSRRVAETLAEGFRAKGCSVDLAPIGFTDKRWSERFTRFPLKHAYLDILGMLPAQMRGATGEIELPVEAREGEYDLVVIGSPTWFFRTSVPVRSFIKSASGARLLKGKKFAIYICCRRYWGINFRETKKMAIKQGGEFVDVIHYTYAGRQVRSLLALLSYFGKGENVPRYLGIPIPPTNLKPGYETETRAFAEGLANRLAPRAESQEV
jgi:menaquinone-dependent protoporphyrinogen IX oxidase